ncbi:MAG: photosystem II biogenesis protein Psp29 [Cyanobacteria bacterium P01_H01_bin.15]
MDKVRTVSDAKREFYALHTKPINSIYRRVIEELLVEMHLLSVNTDFQVDPIYCLGVVSSYDRFMQGYRPEPDIPAMYNALCCAVHDDPGDYRQQANKALGITERLDKASDFTAWLKNPDAQSDEEGALADAVKAISANPKFKYSRLFGTGMYMLLEKTEPAILETEDARGPILEEISSTLGLPVDKFKKDVDLYRSNLEKLTEMLKVIEDAIEAGRKQMKERAERKEQEAATKAEAENAEQSDAPTEISTPETASVEPTSDSSD